MANNVKPINEKVRRSVMAAFWILLALVILLNVGKVARTLAFPFIYLFGASYYLYASLPILFAIIYLAKGGRKGKSNVSFYIGLIFFMIAATMLIGVILMNKADYKDEISYATPIKELFAGLNSELPNYYKSGTMNLFASSSHYNTGAFGIALGSIFGSNDVTLTMGIAFMVVGVLFMSFRPLGVLIAFIRRKSDYNKGVKKAKKAAEVKPKKEEPSKPVRPVIIFEEEPDYDEGLYFEDDGVDVNIPVGFAVEDEPKEQEEDVVAFTKSFLSLDSEAMDIKEDEEFRKLSLDDSNDVVEKFESYVEPVSDKEEKVEESDLYDDSFIENEEVYLSMDEFEDEKPAEKKPEVAPSVPLVPNQQAAAPVRPAPAPAPMPFVAPVAPPPMPKPEEKPKKKPRVNWIPPSTELLDVYETAKAIEMNSQAADQRVELINEVLGDFKIRAQCTSYTIGSSVTRFNIEYDPGVSVSLIEKRVTDIARKLNGANCRFTPLVEGESFSGLEVPNPEVTTVSFKEVFEALPDVKKDPLAVGFGKNISGEVVAANFDEFPHLLVAGTTGSGKSIYIHSIIATLIMRNSPDDLKIVLVDPKKVEMTKYRDMPHLLTPIITEANKAKVMLSKLVDEMNDRYSRFSIADSCSNIKQYNAWAKENNEEFMPYIIVVLDEYADLVDTCKEISQPVVSIAQKARAAGIHLLISTQRPSTNVITGVIKGNLPTHVALMTSSAVDSMTILGEGGAEKLLGKGDMLVQSPLVSRVGCVRLQGCFIHNREIGRVVAYLKDKYETVYDEKYLDLVDHASEAGASKVASGEVLREANDAEEEKYQEIKAWVMTQKFVSMSRIQRECFVGFNRAGRYFNRLQKEGVVSTQQDGATKGCKVLINDDYDSGDDYPTSDELIS